MGCTSGNNDFFQNWEAGFKDGNRFFVGHTALVLPPSPEGTQRNFVRPVQRTKKGADRNDPHLNIRSLAL
jgi:hypothetical protein